MDNKDMSKAEDNILNLECAAETLFAVMGSTEDSQQQSALAFIARGIKASCAEVRGVLWPRGQQNEGQ